MRVYIEFTSVTSCGDHSRSAIAALLRAFGRHKPDRTVWEYPDSWLSDRDVVEVGDQPGGDRHSWTHAGACRVPGGRHEVVVRGGPCVAAHHPVDRVQGAGVDWRYAAVWTRRLGWPADRESALRVLRRAVELGVNFIDTADAYGPHVNEEQIAEALFPYRRRSDDCHQRRLDAFGPGAMGTGRAPAHLREACEGSLRRLRIECIDLYQLHAVIRRSHSKNRSARCASCATPARFGASAFPTSIAIKWRAPER